MAEVKGNNDQIAQSIAGFIDKHGTTLWNGIKSLYKKASDETRLNWRLGYENYLDTALSRYYFAKPFLSANQPIALSEFYVPLGISSGKHIIEETSIEDLVSGNQFTIITATAGSGKSMMMRHLFIDTIKSKGLHQVPVLIELRDLNNTDLPLFELIKKKLRDNNFAFEDIYIEKAFKAGHFLLLLDGFDEITREKREKTIIELQELADKYDQNYFILSSRPDDSLSHWTLFNIWTISPLSLKLACKLVEKTSEENELKAKFIKALQDGLFEKNKSFLSNPLLLSIMLLTYKDSANIPNKLSTFYERAYIALFERHDAHKGAYNREKLSKLDIIDFKKVFSAFCFLTYYEGISFSETEIFEYLKKAQKLSGINFDKKGFLEDSIQAVCLLIRDGLDITFVHRSLQDYFTAFFTLQIDSNEKKASLFNVYFNEEDRLSHIYKHFSTFNLIHELNPDSVESLFLLPAVENFENHIQRLVNSGVEVYEAFVRTLAAEFILWREKGADKYYYTLFASDLDNENLPLCQFLLEKYSNSAVASEDDFPDDKFKERVFSKFNKPPYHGHVMHPIVDLRIPITEFLKESAFIKILKKSDTIYSEGAYLTILQIYERLLRKHQEQELFLDELIFE